MASRTATVIYIGDADSLVRESERAAAATEGATAKIAAANTEAGKAYLSMSGAGKKAADELESSHSKIVSGLAGIATSGNAAVAGLAAFAVAAEAVKKSADTLDELTKTTLQLHNATGLSTASASKYAAIAKVQDISAGGLTQAFGTLSKNVQAVTNAHEGLTKSAKTQENAFKQLGISTKTLTADHHDMNLILPQVLEKFEKMPASTEKAALGMTLFGRGYKTLVPLLHEGALGLKELEEEAKAMGVTLGGSAQENAVKMAQAQDKLKFASLGLQVALAEKVAPAITTLISDFGEGVEEIRSGSGEMGKAARSIGEGFDEAKKIAGPAIHGTVALLEGMETSVMGAAHAVKGILTLNFTEAWSGVKGIFAGGIHAAEGELEAAIAPFKFIGKEMIHGLVEGLEAGAGEVTSEAEKLAHLPGKALHDVLGIESPSKVMHQYGEWTTEGFANGLAAGKGNVAAGLNAGLLGPVHDAMAHIAANGGFTAASGTNYSKGEEPQIAKDLNELGKYLHVNLTGISGYRTPQHSVEVGGYADDPHTRGEASDTEGAQRIAESVLEKFGLTRPIKNNPAEADHIQLLAGSAAAAAHAVAHASGGGGVGEEVFNFFRSKGLSAAQAAGIVGNFQQESTLNPKEAGGGLDQGQGSRDHSSGNLQEQLKAIWKELTGEFSGALSAVKGAGSPQAAAIAFEKLFEKPEKGSESKREKYAEEAYKRYAGDSSAAARLSAAVKKVEHLSLTVGQKASLHSHAVAAGGDHGIAETAAGRASAAGRLLEMKQARWALSTPDLTTPTGQSTAKARAGYAVKNEQTKKKYYERELKALQKEAAEWGKIRDSYRKYARHAHGPGAKKEALDKATQFEEKVKGAQNEAKELGGTIVSTETAILEAEHTENVTLPKEIAEAVKGAEDEAASKAAEGLSNDFSAYQAANSKIDLEERAKILTPEEAKAKKIANAKEAEAGGFGALSEEDLLTVKGDLVEFSEATKEATSALEAHTEALKESAKALNEFTHAGEGIAKVEAGSLAKSIADIANGQIAGVNYQGRKLTAGAGTAARY